MSSDSPPIDETPSWVHLLNLEEAEQFSDRSWRPEELAAVFRHQLASPVQFDLHAVVGAAGGQLQALCAREGLLVRSFNDLLFHRHPPVELLEMTKRFAKASYYHPDAILPRDIASLLYYASILVARLRCGKKITDLDDAALAEGVRWAIARPWIDDAMRKLLGEGLQTLTPALVPSGGDASEERSTTGQATREVR